MIRSTYTLVLLPCLSLVALAATTPPDGKGGDKRLHPLTSDDFDEHSEEKVELGRLLFFDKELSGNRNISCATCHHSLTDTGDGLSLPLGEGAAGLGVTRATGGNVHERVPRNAPPVFNLGAKAVTVMFHDGRVAVDEHHASGFTSPAGDDLPAGLDSVLAAQAMFPVTSATEMAGQPGENSIADAAGAGNLAGAGGVWELLAQRLQAIPEYVALFQAAYPGEVVGAADVTFVHAANAIAAFEGTAWRAIDTPFDRALRGDHGAMSRDQRRGAKLFFGRAGCGDCHSGPLLSDEDFHAIAMPQIGPGKGDGTFGYEDFGREQATGDARDRYRFRTPPLRNVALTGPWGHAAPSTRWRASSAITWIRPSRCSPSTGRSACSRPTRRSIPWTSSAWTTPTSRTPWSRRTSCAPTRLSERDVELLLEFLHALTDPSSIDLRIDVPFEVPSGLSVTE